MRVAGRQGGIAALAAPCSAGTMPAGRRVDDAGTTRAGCTRPSAGAAPKVRMWKVCCHFGVAFCAHCYVNEPTAHTRHVTYTASVLTRASYLTAPSHHTWQAARGPLKVDTAAHNL
jgi:hypothetical protein